MGIYQMLLLKFGFDIYSVLNEKKLIFLVDWFIHILWLVQPAVFHGSGHCIASAV